ncbi:penicillin-binding protein 1C [Desulfovibrio inopinatus]|uniref:penicillin-binding protein 1C n=1 Tax=Desulfovibrio inopinatus TaxID=102109 RepID=UPI002480B1B5|nr:penicillin-binding protein 1C [Desulfovibrio inopinatus]
MDKDGNVMRLFLPHDDMWRFPVELQDVSLDYIQTVLASEDRHYYQHPGINPLAIIRAAIANIKAGYVVSGGSTITMQLARLLEPKERTVWSKIIESFRALQLEATYDKQTLLERYVNLAPYGRNIVGVGAAAYFYFRKAPSSLSVAEAALLTVLPRAPTAFDPIRNPDVCKAARDRVLDQLAAHGVITVQQSVAAKSRPLPTSLAPIPFRAPHFARMVRDGAGNNGVVHTTIDAGIQTATHKVLVTELAELRRQGIENAAAVVIETETGAVRAFVGSANFFDADHAGQIDGVTMQRSPGSSLKPLLYAQAFDAGIIVPDSILLDVPTRFGFYEPRNYDGQFRGRVTAEDALIHSLNVPAVRLLSEVGLDSFYGLMRKAGISTLDKPAAFYGLPLVLGAAEARLLDVTAIYAAFARGGLYMRPRLLQNDVILPNERICSTEAAAFLTDILSQVERPDLPRSWKLSRNAVAVAWKTGTSFGHRDAWAFGYSGRYAVGVWVGSFSGKPIQGISGARQAGPLLFDVFKAIEPSGSRLPSFPGAHFGEIVVCELSRQLPGPACPETRTIRSIPGVSRFVPDTTHRRIFLDADTGWRLRGDCLAGHRVVSGVAIVNPPELTAWRLQEGLPVEPVARLAPECRHDEADAPHILSPIDMATYQYRQGVPKQYQRLAFQARPGQGAVESMLYWYVDGILIGQVEPGQTLFYDLEPGRHDLMVVDENGASNSIVFIVESRKGAG